MFRRGNLVALALVALVALFAPLASCNTTCLPSADIQVDVVPSPSIDPASIAHLHVALSVNGGPAKSLVITPLQPISGTGSAFVLRPDSAPAKAMYSVTVTIEAMDASGRLIAIGSDSEQVAAKGCNQLKAELSPLPPTPIVDMALPPGADGFQPVFDMTGSSSDLAGCVGGMPDEDNDGRANNCDLCPADYDPTPSDADGDGLPDACDPDPNKAANRLVYFDPFNAMSGHWMGTFSVPANKSYLLVDSRNAMNQVQFNTPINVSNSVDKVPLDVRVQTYVMSPGYYSNSSQALAIITLFLGDGPDPFAPGTNGVVCQIRFDQANGDNIRLEAITAGALDSQTKTQTPTGNCSSQTLPPPPQFCFQNNTLYRIRLTQRGSNYACDVIDDAGNDYQPAPLTATPPAGPTQIVVLQEENMQAQFNSVEAETALP